jgi:hypothetical protein
MPIDYGDTMTEEDVHVDGTHAATETFEGVDGSSDGEGDTPDEQQTHQSLDLPTPHTLFATMADRWEQLSETVTQRFKEARGSVALSTHAGDIARWLRMCEDRAERALTNLRSVKGEAHPAREIGYTKRSLKRVAEEYFEKLSPKALQIQCTLFQVAYTPDNTELMISALVERQLEMSIEDTQQSDVPF